MRDLGLVAFLFVLSIAPFLPAIDGSFQFDDIALLDDPAITSPGGWIECFRLEQTRSLTWLTFWVSYQLHGTSTFGWHATNFALHASSVLLLLFVLRRLIPEPAALTAAAIFAVHPIQTEAVAYIFARAILLATVFSLASIRAWIAGKPWRAVLWFALALLAKEECVALPLLLAILRRDRWRPIAAMLGLASLAGVRVLWAASVIRGSGAGTESGITPLDYFVTQGVAIWRYLRLLILPWGFTVDPAIRTPEWAGVAGWLAIAALVAAIWFRSDRELKQKAAGFWIIAGLLLLMPSSSILPAADLAADRRMYLPMIAFASAAGLLFTKLDFRVFWIAGLALGVQSYRTAQLWKSSEDLWRNAYLAAPEKIRPRVHLARAMPADQALDLLKDADHPDLLAERGRIHLERGDTPAALQDFGRALALSPGDPRALNNRGAALLALGETEAAVADFERALERDPCYFDALWNLARSGKPRPPPSHCRLSPRRRAMLETSTAK